MPFWYLRHGETDYNARGLSQGAIDTVLNADGREQARAAARRLDRRGIAGIVASPMRRTAETAAIVNETLRVPVSFEPALREVVFGGMEGRPLLPWFEEWTEGRFTPAGAETFAEVMTRVAGALDRVLRHPGPLLIVGHGGVFRAVRRLMGLPAPGPTPNGMALRCAPGAAGWQVEME